MSHESAVVRPKRTVVAAVGPKHKVGQQAVAGRAFDFSAAYAT